ncbi:MAG: hypothetical protein HOP28_01710 [Gemmatimonadales bacterium]|nr:hypothetical protein [Gemmatimonadales bacterium]
MKSTLLLAIGSLALGAVPLSAQYEGTVPLVLKLPGGARALGLGNAFTAGRGPEVIFYNPAQIGLNRGTTLSLQRFGSASTLGALSTAGPFGKVAIAAGVQYLDYGADLTGLTPEPGDLTRRGALNAASLVAGIAVQYIWKGVRFGAGAKYAEERVATGRDGGLLFDFGAGREFGNVTLALAVQHVGSDIGFAGYQAKVPTRVSLGGALPRTRLGTFFDLGLAASVARERDGRIVPAAGAELVYAPVDGWTFVARAGVRRTADGSSVTRAESPVSVGGSFGLDRLWVDYAFEPYKGPGATHRIGIRIQ